MQAGMAMKVRGMATPVDLVTIEAQQIKRRKLASSRHRDVVLRESNNHQHQMEHSQEVLDFIRDEFSKYSPNLFLQQEPVRSRRGCLSLLYVQPMAHALSLSLSVAPIHLRLSLPFPASWIAGMKA